jgi:hypothetical protein
LYAIEPNGVRKVMDLRLGFHGYKGLYYKVESFGDYIIIFPHIKYFYSSGGSQHPSEPYYYKLALDTTFTSALTSAGVSIPESVNSYYMLNMRSGSLHAIKFRDAIDSSISVEKRGAISDMYFSPQDDVDNNLNLFILTNSDDATQSNNTRYRKGYCYYTEVSYPNTELEQFQDRIYSTVLSSYITYSPEVLIEIDSFLPDDVEYNIKKFRNLLLFGKFPSQGMNLQVAYDNRAYGDAILLTDDAVANDNRRPPFPHRVGLNQRSRSISLMLSLDRTEIIPSQTDLTIEDIRVYWSPTLRAPIRRNQDLSSNSLS